MRSISRIPVRTVLALAALLTLGACADTQGPSGSRAAPGPVYSYGTPPAAGMRQVEFGVLQGIERVRVENTGIGGSGIGAGTIVGAVVGGIVGNQIGKGGGNTAATVIGAAGGAYAGNVIEKRNPQSVDAYRLTVRMRDGSYLALTQTTADGLRVGDRVQVLDGVAQRY